MSSSTNSSTRRAISGCVLALLLLSACATAEPQEPASLRVDSLLAEGMGTSRLGFPITRWAASVSGGSGELRYQFRTLKGAVEIIEQTGASPAWECSPRKPGTYRVKVVAWDAAGAAVESDWSAGIVVPSPITKDSLIAVLPVENLSGGRAPLEEVGALVRTMLLERGVRLVRPEDLDEFMRRYRIRDTGGLHAGVSQAMREETGAHAYLVTSLEAFQDTSSPAVSVVSRLVTSGGRSEILWMDGIGLSGDGHPGLLGLGVIDSSGPLLEDAIGCLADSLDAFLTTVVEPMPSAAANSPASCSGRHELGSSLAVRRGSARHRPRTLFRSPRLRPDKRYRIAVVPFLNLSNRNNAGKIMALHFATQLSQTENFSVVEPGLLREQLLKYRIVMQDGPSLANAELIAADESLAVDLVFSGTVFEYQDSRDTPKVDFAVKVIDAKSRTMVWSSRSHNSGDDGVVFFDMGRIDTAHRLAAEMAKGTFSVVSQVSFRDALPGRARPRAPSTQIIKLRN